MEYHALFVIFERSSKFFNCILLQIVGRALRVKVDIRIFNLHIGFASVDIIDVP